MKGWQNSQIMELTPKEKQLKTKGSIGQNRGFRGVSLLADPEKRGGGAFWYWGVRTLKASEQDTYCLAVRVKGEKNKSRDDMQNNLSHISRDLQGNIKGTSWKGEHGKRKENNTCGLGEKGFLGP